MITDQQANTLTAEQATAQIQAWIAAGMPAGDIYIPEGDRVPRMAVIVPTRDDVEVWAAALGDKPFRGSHTFGLAYVKPAQLPGWRLSVWTPVNELPAAPITIEVLR